MASVNCGSFAKSIVSVSPSGATFSATTFACLGGQFWVPAVVHAGSFAVSGRVVEPGAGLGRSGDRDVHIVLRRDGVARERKRDNR
jgi:hypothetical protein